MAWDERPESFSLNMRTIVRKLGYEDGVEIAEAAMVLPLVFTLLLGIVWFGRAFNIYSTIQQAAQQGAITAARGSCATCGNTPASDVTVDNVIYAVMNASHLDPTQIPASANPGLFPCPAPPGGWAVPAGCAVTGNNIYVCRNVQLNPTAGATQPAQCGTVVSFQYPFKSYLPFTALNLQTVTMSAQAQSRMEN
jgi:hypothetical protein